MLSPALPEARQFATMDILLSGAYLCRMILRLITMLAIVAITVATTVSSAHAAGMGSVPDHATHVGEMMQSADIAGQTCDAGQPCGSADAEMCEFVCTGLSAFLTSPGEEAGHFHGTASHDFPSDAIHVSRAPGLNERPPKLRFF